MIIDKNDIDLKQVKLIIWDLDNTFWKGTISEGPITIIEDHINLVKELANRGIVCSICSKNNYDECRDVLQKADIWDYFVFPSIDWSPKGARVFQIIRDMKLRPDNTLFLDDEPANLQHAVLQNNRLICGTIQELGEEIEKQLVKLQIDNSKKRLKQYQELSKKVEKRKEYDSDEEFLRISNIKVSVCKDCEFQLERISELILRTNQLNFTKKRINKNELSVLLASRQYDCGYIRVEDRFCDYGIVGFYALQLQEHRLEHFLFSCRTIGMGVEQFIFAELGSPKIEIKGDVVAQLGALKPDWISLSDNTQMVDRKQTAQRCRILVKGPCDVSQIIPFFSNESVFDTEFSYVSESKYNAYIEGYNHTSEILASQKIEKETKEWLIANMPFIDEQYYETSIFSGEYDFVILSMVSDFGLGMYQSKSNPKLRIPLFQHTIDYTVEENWNGLLKKVTTMSDDEITKTYDWFHNEFEYVGRISLNQMIENLSSIRNLLPKNTILMLQNGSEFPYGGDAGEEYADRHLIHREMNAGLKKFVESHSENTIMIDVNDCIQSSSNYLDTLNHFKKVVYFRLAKKIQEEMEKCVGANLNEVKSKSILHLYYVVLQDKIRRIKYYYKKLLRKYVGL